jgi:hypothetical protein
VDVARVVKEDEGAEEGNGAEAPIVDEGEDSEE